jgi:hypothetical protein
LISCPSELTARRHVSQPATERKDASRSSGLFAGEIKLSKRVKNEAEGLVPRFL